MAWAAKKTAVCWVLACAIPLGACRTDDDKDIGETDTVIDTEVGETDETDTVDTELVTETDETDTVPLETDETDPVVDTDDSDDSDPVVVDTDDTDDTGDTDPVVVDTGDTDDSGDTDPVVVDTDDSADTLIVVDSDTSETDTVDTDDTTVDTDPLDTDLEDTFADSWVDTFVAIDTVVIDTYDTDLLLETADTGWDTAVGTVLLVAEASDVTSGVAPAGGAACLKIGTVLDCVGPTVPGEFRFRPPARTRPRLFVTAPGTFDSVYFVDVGTSRVSVAAPTFLRSSVDTIYTQAAETVQPGRAQVVFMAINGSGAPQSGVSINTGVPTSSGPIYLDPFGAPSAVATSTSTNGMAFLPNMLAITGRVSWTHPTLTCTPDLAWPGGRPDSARVTLERGWLHVISVVCR